MLNSAEMKALSKVSRALGLAQALEDPILPGYTMNGVREVASEIVVLLTAVSDSMVAAAGGDEQDSDA
jgi:hypothetical protein